MSENIKPVAARAVSYVLLLLTFVLFPAHSFAQYVVGGGTPARIRWMQVEGDTYKVVYPQGADSLAKRYLWLLESNKNAVMMGLGGIRPAKLPVVLYNRTANSNGMVVWAPKRMELYTLPMGNSYSQKWDEQLALHESRHVGQMTHFTKGVYRGLSFFLGEQAPSIGVGIYPSRWMLEGDAVVAETELSNSGRGRSAEFMEYYRAAFLEGDMRNWDRWRLGSYKRYTPNIYAAGYLVNSTIRYKTGKYAYAGEIFEGLVKNFYNPSVIGKVYGGSVGMKPEQYFYTGQQMMLDIWQDELGRRGNITNPQQVLESREKGYQEYLSPAVVGKDSLLYIKYSYNNPKRLVMVSGGKEHILRSFSASATGFRLSGDEIWFTENVSSSRWGNEVYSKLYSYNWKTGKGAEGMREILGKGWFSGPNFNSGGDSVVVVEYFPEGGCAIVVLDFRSGQRIRKITVPAGWEVKECAFLGEDIYALVVTGEGLGLFRLGNGNWETVIGEQNATIASLQAAKVPARMLGMDTSENVDVLYFVSDADGVRNIYMVEPVEGIWKRLTNSEYGATEPYISNGILYYSSLELGGRYPVKVDLADIVQSGSPFEPYLSAGKLCGLYKYEVAEVLTAQAKAAFAEKGLPAYGTVSEQEFVAGVEPRRYSKLGHLFRFHSWAPVYYNVDRIMEFDFDNLYQVAGLGATAYSQNTLGSAITMLGYSYHKGLHAGHVKFKYTGWYPAFQLSADINAEEHVRVKVVRDSSSVKSVTEQVQGPLVQLGGQVYLPLRFNSHGWQRGITPQFGFSYDNNGNYDSSKGKYLHNGQITAALQFYIMRDMANSAIYPKWGFGGVAKSAVPVNGGENFGDISSLHLYGYLPGIAASHGLKLAVSLQQQSVEGKNYWMGNLVGMPRGYKENFYSKSYVMWSADYAFPIYLGDIGLWELAYLKRMQVIPFVDYAIGKSLAAKDATVRKAGIYSYGADLLVDCAPFKFGIECSVGIRCAYNGNNANLPGKGASFQLLFSTALP